MLPSSIFTDYALVSSSSTTPSSSSSSSSSSSTSTPSTFSPASSPSLSLLQNPRAMEEVWKDISITSLPNTPIPQHYNNNNPNPTSNSNFRGVILQDFLNTSEAANRAPPSSIYRGPPATTLSLNSASEFQFLDINNTHCATQLQTNPLLNFSAVGHGEPAFDALPTSSVLNPFVASSANNKFPENEDNGTVDRRRKRMIKNRESAARSRARKQAYITELQHEVTHLQEENDRLRKQLQQVHAATAAVHEHPKKHGLRRSSTAPF